MLIHVAYAFRKNDQKVADIQARLIQGVIGMTCPFPEKGEINERAIIIKRLFMEAMRNNKPPVYSQLALQLFENMMFETDADIFTPKSSEDDMLTKSIEELELPIRAYRFLKSININTIGELVQKTETEILKERNAGQKILSQIKDALIEHDLYFAVRT
ncbi:MAG TPA: DNA-directed RNA polymerase subunit alpha C-terminal domain-containing protein [Candidatus Moranbacteria bacterium]|nr:DNA-directed RNA polymerase subunit alpha C-terminal domain-containing protein [Candidatus Moranbacteria bacterium]HRZ33554.1 DNA-directed RNA polymerase subunit alpha C-terminal domain-containing protein [Candidatus Moranbacteria bacterium]